MMANGGESINDALRKLLQDLYNCQESDFSTISKILSDFRILTREKTLDHELLDEKCIIELTNHSENLHTEAQKCLSNLILNYSHLRDKVIEPYVSCFERRLKTVLSDKNPIKHETSRKQLCEVLHYDLRIVFLLSALCASQRARIRDRLLEPILELTREEAAKFSHDNYLLVVECLKTLFNLTLDKCVNKSLVGDVIKKLFSVVGTENDMIDDCKTNSEPDQTDRLLVNLIHLLTNMPDEVYLRLSYEDVDKILNHLDNQLKSYSKHCFRDTVLPVLNVCANVCKHNPEIQKRWFEEIIASAKDFEKRPEEYDNLRGRLVRLMTSVDVHIKDIAAEFMHALCGGDTEKFITYTGFGNSAAFLSSRGLLLGKDRRKVDDRSDLDFAGNTDYQQIRDKIDPITGKLETPKKNPMEGMTEEEKEYHAHELADAITKLSNLGVVKPMSVDQDGRMTELQPGFSEATGEKNG